MSASPSPLNDRTMTAQTLPLSHYADIARRARATREYQSRVIMTTTHVRPVRRLDRKSSPVMFKRVGGLTFVRFFRLNLQLSISRR